MQVEKMTFQPLFILILNAKQQTTKGLKQKKIKM